MLDKFNTSPNESEVLDGESSNQEENNEDQGVTNPQVVEYARQVSR